MKSRFLVIFAILALSLSACVSLAEDITPPPDANRPVAVETEAPAEVEESEAVGESAEGVDGETLYLAHCARCHNEDGSGANNIGADLTDTERISGFPDKMIGALILKGNGEKMPPVNANLNDVELGRLIAYVRNLSEGTQDAESVDDGEEQAENASEMEADLTGDVKGKVTNGTGGTLPDNLTVQLEIYEHDMMTGGFNKIDVLESQIAEDGAYLFEDVEMIEGRAFLAIIDDEGVIYSSQPNFVTEGSIEASLPITYFEKSSDSNALTLDRLHIFFEPPDAEAEIAHVVEVFVVSNPSLYAIVPNADEAVVRFLLPEGASNIQFEDSVFGERYTEIEGGFGDKEPILPGIGAHEVIVFFDMPFEKKFLQGNSLDFTQKIGHPIDSAIAMSPQGLKITSDLLQESGEREAQGLIYNTYSSQPLPIGATFEMTVSGKVSATATGGETNSQQNIVYGVLALGLVLIGAGVWFYLRDRNEEDDYEDDDYEDDSVEYDDADKLMDAIIALDDAYRAGDISEEVYKKRRGSLKEQLKELV